MATTDRFGVFPTRVGVFRPTRLRAWLLERVPYTRRGVPFVSGCCDSRLTGVPYARVGVFLLTCDGKTL